jgi:uncharacterized membrane protein
MKNKTLTTWLTLVLGAFGLHRFYLYGSRDAIAWLMPIPTALGVYGFERVAEYGLDDVLSWWLLPLLGFHLAAVCLTAIVYGLMPQERWNLRFNPEADVEASAGATSWMTIFPVIISLMLGTVFLLSAFAYAFQRYFEVTV